MATANEPIEDDEVGLIDATMIRHYLGFAFRSIRRRPLLFLGVTLSVIAATVVTLLVMPRSYHVETTLLAQKAQALTVGVDAQGMDTQTHGATETVKRRENLIALIKQTDLPHKWYQDRAPILHLKDVINRAIRGDESEQDRLDWMADLLDKKLQAWTNEGVVTIQIDWPDPKMGFHLVESAGQNYLEARHVAEISTIAEKLAILQNHASDFRSEVDTAVASVVTLRQQRAASLAGSATAPPPPSPLGGMGPAPHSRPPPDPQLQQLRVMIETKQRAITDLEDFRRRRLSELNARLAEVSATYTENHPTVVDLKQTIESLSSESPQVQALRKEVAQGQEEFNQLTARAAADSADGRPIPFINPISPPPALPNSIIRIEQEPDDERDPAIVYARGQLHDAMEKYAQLRDQIAKTEIDLETAQAAFKYRYTVIQPAQVPKKPRTPNVLLVSVAGFLAALVVGLASTVVSDIRAGRFLERWQIERLLQMPVLTELELEASSATEPK